MYVFIRIYRCISSDILSLSSVCSSDLYSVYNYTTLDRFQNIVKDLTLAFQIQNMTIGDICTPSVQAYMCSYFFPPCVNNQPHAICEETCENYLHNGVCANYFTDLLNYLTTINSTIISEKLFNKSCSAFLQSLYGVETRDFGCNRLNGQ